LLLLLNYVVLRALWKIDVHLISTLVNKSLYYYYKHIYSKGATTSRREDTYHMCGEQLLAEEVRTIG